MIGKQENGGRSNEINHKEEIKEGKFVFEVSKEEFFLVFDILSF